VDSSPFGKYEMARFAPHVTAAADAGDAIAREVLARAGYDLAHNAIAIARQLGMMAESCAVVPIGGVFRSSDWVVPAFRQTLAAHLPRAVITAPRHAPQVGAAILALRRPAEHDLGSWSLGTGHRRIRRSLSVAEASPAR
jgi:N-acetylglucosamine kinase-like BadF-type ATPase